MDEYINRKALRKVLENWRDAHADVDDEKGCGLLEDVIWEVDAQPAADAAPVVHGRLVREVREVTDAVSIKGWACSVCGGFVKNQPVDRWRYCPFCGTPFDGGDLDGQKV